MNGSKWGSLHQISFSRLALLDGVIINLNSSDYKQTTQAPRLPAVWYRVIFPTDVPQMPPHSIWVWSWSLVLWSYRCGAQRSVKAKNMIRRVRAGHQTSGDARGMGGLTGQTARRDSRNSGMKTAERDTFERPRWQQVFKEVGWAGGRQAHGATACTVAGWAGCVHSPSYLGALGHHWHL